MRPLLGLALALLLAAPAEARPQLIARGDYTVYADPRTYTTTLTLADPATVEPRAGSVTVPGAVTSFEGSPDGTRLATLGDEVRCEGDLPPARCFGAVTFVDTATMQPLDEPVELEGDLLTALWSDPARLVVVTDRAPTGLEAAVVAIDTDTHAEVGRTTLAGAPGDAMRVGNDLLVVETNRRNTEDGTITPVLRVFAADGTPKQTISLRALKGAPEQRLTYIHLRAGGGVITAFAAASGRFASIDLRRGRLTEVRRTRLRSDKREPLLSAGARWLLVARNDFGNPRIYRVDRRTGAARLLRRSRVPRSTGSGYMASGEFGVRRYGPTGKPLWTGLKGGVGEGCSVLRYGIRVYACDGRGQVHALSLRTGRETGLGPEPASYPGILGEADGGYLFTHNLGGTELDP
jgi:hypothetical protein